MDDSSSFPQKQCTGECKQWLPDTSDFFHRCSRGGFNTRCKVCRNWENKIFRDAHPGYRKGYYQEHQESIIQRNRRYPSRKSYHASYYQANRNQLLTQTKAYKEEHPETVRAGRMHYQQTERGKERHAASEHSRRARKRSTGGSYTPQEIEVQYKRQKGKCHYCRNKMATYHIEHVIPISRGGTNDSSNIVLACPTCNMSKGNKLPHEWPQGGRLM